MLISVAADDAKFRAQLRELLEGGGHKVMDLPPSLDGLPALRAGKPHLLVVASRADSAAAAFIRGLRAHPDLRLLPILCVDPKAGSSDTVVLLDAGADDAITRPFQPPIFLARVRTLLRRAVWAGDAPEEIVTVLTGGPIELKLVSRQALVGGRPVVLTRLEFDLLAHLLKHPDRAFKRDELLAAVWNYPGSVETRTLDKHVESLRRKMGACAPMIQTVHGVGYRFTPGDAVRR
ncbi:MAG: response regulator transcription factor [Elusimicrobiota bacterium]|nr:response regulator transcription factor [Elusimicrobiota bacterium]